MSQSDAVISLVSFALGSYWGVLIRRAGTCAAALEKVRERAPQVAVVDADIETACDLVSEMGRREIPVVIINTKEDIASVDSVVRIPAPLQPDRLRAALEQITSTK